MEKIENSVIAVDIGGTKIAAAIVSSEGKLSARAEVPTCQTGQADGLLQIGDLIESVRKQAKGSKIESVGIGIPAVLEEGTRRVIWAPNIQGWRDFDLKLKLEEKIGLPVFIEYDGHTAILGEWWQGAGKNCDSLVMVVIGTGIGGGIILNNKLVRGKSGLAGAVGWFAMTSDSHQADQNNKHIGHWESMAAGPGIARRALEVVENYPESPLKDIPADDLTAQTVFEMANEDACCQEIVRETGRILGLGLSNIVDLINPEKIILGGSVGLQLDMMRPEIEKVLLNWAQPISARDVVIEKAMLGNAGLLGAAYAAFQRSDI